MAAVAGLVGAAPGGLAPATAAPGAPTAPARLQIVALGDSYTAGNGAGSYVEPDDGCHRSGAAYPELYATQLRAHGAVVGVWNVACSGARVEDLHTQLDEVPAAVARRADLALLSIGGNDLGFLDAVRCLLGSPLDAGCDTLVAARRAAIPDVMRATRTALAAVGRRLPRARVMLLGYPSLSQPACRTSSLNAAVDAGQRDLDRAQSALVAALPRRFRFVSVRSTYAGHGPCAPLARQYVHGLVLLPLFETFHPNRAGHQATADLLSRRLGGAVGLRPR